MTSPLPPVFLLDALLRGMLLALLALLAWAFGRDRPALPAVRAGVALAVGLAVQTAGAMPWFEEAAPRLLQAPIVAVSVGNAVLFWIFVRALFDDAFGFRPVHALAWGTAAGLGGLNCAVFAHSGTTIAPFTMGLQRAVPLLFALLTVQAAAAGWRVDLIEGRRRLRGFIVVAGVAYTLLQLAARLASSGGRRHARYGDAAVHCCAAGILDAAYDPLGAVPFTPPDTRLLACLLRFACPARSCWGCSGRRRAAVRRG